MAVDQRPLSFGTDGPLCILRKHPLVRKMVLKLSSGEITYAMQRVQNLDIFCRATHGEIIVFFRHHIGKLLLELVYLSKLPVDL